MASPREREKSDKTHTHTHTHTHTQIEEGEGKSELQCRNKEIPTCPFPQLFVNAPEIAAARFVYTEYAFSDLLTLFEYITKVRNACIQKKKKKKKSLTILQ